MTVVPRYAFATGTEISLFERRMVVTGQDDRGYLVADLDAGGATTVLPYMRLVERLKLPGARIDTDLPMTGGRLAQRLGGYASTQALPEAQREMAQVHLALCQAMQITDFAAETAKRCQSQSTDARSAGIGDRHSRHLRRPLK